MEAKVAMGASRIRTYQRVLGYGLLWFAARPALAQTVVPQAAVLAELQNLTAQASTIFVGQIERTNRRGNAVDVVFRVEQPVRGAVGPSFVLHEWAGSWPPGHTRYLVGQRVLAFVYGRSGAGFHSPVHGVEGLVPVVVQGADAPRLLDIRRVAASVVREPGTALPTEANGALDLQGVLLRLQGGDKQISSFMRLPIPVRARAPLDVLRGSGSESQVDGPVTVAGKLPGTYSGFAGQGHALR